jgi:hypothetical protein
MFRRIGVLVAASAMAAAVVAGGGTAGAAKPPVTATGQIYCQITGRITFFPKLVFNGTTPMVARYKAKTGYCYSGPDFVDEPVAGITGATLSGSFEMPTNDCGTGGGGVDGGPNAFAAKWKATGHRVVPTTVSLSSASMLIVSASIDNPLLASDGTILTSGSFPGTIDGSLHATMFSPKGDVATLCQPKTKGVPGSGGLKKLEFGGGDSFFTLEDGTPPTNP